MHKVKITRQKLYDLVWSEPLISLVKKYSISQIDLKKICEKMSIPLPGVGHWQKLQYGKNPTIEALPLEYSGEQEIALILREEGEEKNSSLLSPLSILQKAIESDRKLSLTVHSKLTNPDKMIIEARDALMMRKAQHSLHDGLINCFGSTMAIRVSPDNLDRALCFMDAFIKLIRARGHKINLENHSTNVIIEDEKIRICLREKLKRTMVKDTWGESKRLHPTGVLCFQIVESYGSKEWTDGKLPLEKQLSKLLAILEIESKEIKEENASIEKYWKEQRKKDRIEREIKERKERELSDFKGLIQEAHRWREVVMLRNYVNDAEAKAIENNAVTEEFKNWLEWARKKIDWYDPRIEAEDELLKNVDKENLVFRRV